MNLYAPQDVRQLMNRHGFQTNRNLGQNFLTDRHVVERIVQGAGIGPDDLVIEIGPGLGVLTRAAAAVARQVIAVEIDRRLLPILAETVGDLPHVQVVLQDILKTDVNGLIEKAKQADSRLAGVHILGNLPYYITTPILMALLEAEVAADSITVMMQKEVADRLMARPGNKTYGAISVAVQYYCQVETVIQVPRQAFFPQPNVDSTVLRLCPYREKPVTLTDPDGFFACIRAGFGQRRKTLLNALSGGLGLPKETVGALLQDSGIDAGRRAETLDLQEFARLAGKVSALRQGRMASDGNR